MINKDLLKKYQPTLSDTALDNFDKYAAHLVERNKQMNLTGITEPDEIVIKHFVDSLKFFEYVDVPQGASIIDVGTGAGFPGLPLLLARNDIALTLMDSLNKRLVFLGEVLKKCDLQAELVHARAEDAGQETCFRETYDFATARAVAPMNVLAEYCLPFVKVGGTFCAMKGAKGAEELDCAGKAIATLGGETQKTETLILPDGGERVLINVKKISHTATKYPRPSAQISKKPLV